LPEGRPKRRFRRTNEPQPNPTSIILFEPTRNNERTGSTSPLAYLFTYHEFIHGLGGLFAFECWFGRRLYSSTRMRSCMYRTACVQYRLCFHLGLFTFLLSQFRHGLSFGGSGARRIHRWLAGVQRAPNGAGVTVMCFSRAVCALLSCCFELTNQINSNQIKTIAKSKSNTAYYRRLCEHLYHMSPSPS